MIEWEARPIPKKDLSGSDAELSENASSSEVPAIGFLLVPGFSLMSYASAVEPLRAANVLAERPLYSWVHLTPDGEPAAASNGVEIHADAAFGEAGPLSVVLVCAAGNPAQFRDRAVFAWLRAESRRGVRMGGVSGGAYVLARAGLLDGHRCTIHWEHAPAFAEEFPAIDLRRTLFEFDRDRMTCAGGIAALDMMHALIEREQGMALAHRVSEWFLQTQVRLGTGAQRMSVEARHAISNPRLAAAIAHMEANIEQVVPRAVLARKAGISLRQLERLFAGHLHRSVGRHYMIVRLERAKVLIRETAMPLGEVALACGFASAAHFSRACRQVLGTSPRQLRRAGRQG